LALASAGGYWMSGRALDPVDEIARTMRRIGARNLSERLSLRGTDDELDRLSTVLNQMLGRLESAFQLVTQFTADASHELRTPVGIIRTTGEVIRARQRTPDEHEAAWDQVILQSERMSGLIDDLLVLARADSGGSDLAIEPMDLSAALEAVTDEIRILAECSGLRLSVSIPADCPMTGDPDAIRRLLLVLLDNAIKYTPAGGEIDVRMRTTDSLTRAAIIEVRDTGPGIESAHLPRIFDRFYRISADRSRRTGGSGLGLSIAQWLASLHGGEILVESVPGTGSTFRVILPLRRISLPNSSFLQNQSA
jgi:signal transduction histidine kinase